jgi:hypothetical protein
MLKKLKLRALSPGQWARTIVPDYECWKEPDSRIRPGEEVDVCLIPYYEPRYTNSNWLGWFYDNAYRRPGSMYFYRERKDVCWLSPSDFGLINPTDSNPNWDKATSDDH